MKHFGRTIALYSLISVPTSITSISVTPKEIKQKLISIKRNATNLEQILKKSKTTQDFLEAPQTPQTIREIFEASRDLTQAIP